jgi:hypothetical protein
VETLQLDKEVEFVVGKVHSNQKETKSQSDVVDKLSHHQPFTLELFRQIIPENDNQIKQEFFQFQYIYIKKTVFTTIGNDVRYEIWSRFFQQ